MCFKSFPFYLHFSFFPSSHSPHPSPHDHSILHNIYPWCLIYPLDLFSNVYDMLVIRRGIDRQEKFIELTYLYKIQVLVVMHEGQSSRDVQTKPCPVYQ